MTLKRQWNHIISQKAKERYREKIEKSTTPYIEQRARQWINQMVYLDYTDGDWYERTNMLMNSFLRLKDKDSETDFSLTYRFGHDPKVLKGFPDRTHWSIVDKEDVSASTPYWIHEGKVPILSTLNTGRRKYHPAKPYLNYLAGDLAIDWVKTLL